MIPGLMGACTFGDGVDVAREYGADVYAQEVRTMEGQMVSLESYRGQVALFVNTASECGLTPQYEGLQRLHERFGEQGFTVLGFPSNDFGGQEPGSAAEIQTYCTENYAVTFPMFDKLGVASGEEQSALYGVLGQAAGTLPSWNFGKYLVNRNGQVVQFFGSRVKPESDEVVQAVELLLGSAGEETAGEYTAPKIELAELYGDFPESVQALGSPLKLNGSALCEWGLLGFNLYRGALYAESPSRDADVLMAVDQRLLIHLRFVRKLSAEQLREAFTASVHYQVGEDSDSEADLRTLQSWMRDVQKGDGMSFVVDPSDGLIGFLDGAVMGRIENEDFARLFVRLYLGNKPPTDALKKGMLGG